jgi:hypothetical protein
MTPTTSSASNPTQADAGSSPCTPEAHQQAVSAKPKEGRMYPMCCTSMYCGRGPESCPSCENWPTLRAFKGWRDEHKATRPDEIWSPLFWVATA